MPRPREFDPDAALESAMQLFWSQGYEATSVDDLCAATGLSRSSLYAAFGDKRALLLKSIDLYADARIAAFLGAALEREDSVRASIEAFLDDLIERIVTGPGRRGCFLGNCAAELAPGDRAAAEHVRRGFMRIEAFFRDALTRAKERGEIEGEPETLARFLTCATQGLLLVGKANRDREALDDIKKVVLRCLDGR
jgi:TetR/AcrR family transcriptional repressor of nem operon